MAQIKRQQIGSDRLYFANPEREVRAANLDFLFERNCVTQLACQGLFLDLKACWFARK